MCAYLSKLHEHVQSCFCASVSFTSSAFDDAAMAPKSSKRYARNSQPFKAGIDGRQKRIHAPDPSARWPKFALSPYATEGCPFYTKGEDESKVLRPAAIAATRSPGNSEWCARPGFALSESAANVEMGTEVLQTYFASAACFAEHFDGLGFKGMASALETAEGKAFMAACNRLNKRNQAEHTSESLAHDVKAWHDFLSDNSEAKARMARKLAMVSGRLYLFAMDFLEQLALVSEPSAFAKAMKTLDVDQPLTAVAAWFKDPDETKKLLKMLAATYKDQVAPKTKGKKKRTLDAASSPSKEGSSKHPASSTSASKKTKKKKSKKHSKKDKSDSRKKAKKDAGKKSKKKKDSSKSEQSSSSSSSTSKPKRKRDRRSPAPAMEALGNSPSPEKSPANEIDLALATWHLSEAQSFKQEWDDLGGVEDRQAAALDRINTLLAAVPGNVLKAYQLELVLPMKKKPSKWRQIAERVDVLVTAAIEFWKKQQQAVGPGDS